MAGRKVAVVTGSNKGIGLAIVRGLCKQFDGDVYLTSRDAGRGQVAVDELKKEGLNPMFHQLDINDHDSIQRLYNFLKEKYGGLDILINNAGIAFKGSAPEPFGQQAEITMATNFCNTLDACNVLFPLLRSHARVANVASYVSQIALAGLSPEKKAQVLGIKKMDELKTMMTEFVAAAMAGTHKEKGWVDNGYGMSKLAVTAMSIVQQAEIDALGKDDLVVNACCPGLVATDMTGQQGITVAEGAETPLFVALLPTGIKEPRGKFIREKKVAAWE